MSLANRRSKPLIADDIVVLARFLLNIDDAFPTKILKSRAPKQKTTGHQAVQHDRVEVQKPGGEDGYIDPTTESADRDKNEGSGENSVIEHERDKGEKKLERFVIREVQRGSDNEEGDTVPVTVTALCDVATNTDIPAKKRTIATQTISVIISEITEMETSDSSFNESLVEASACRETVHTPINQATSDRALRSWYEEEMFKIDKKCDRAEKRLDKVEFEQRKELSVLRAEQSLIREDMERLRNRVQKESASTYRTSTQVNAQRVDRPTNQAASNGLNLDSTWDASKEQRQILTQDSQGETVHTPINQATSDRALLSWYEEEMFKIDKKCDRAEKRLDKVEFEQRKELSVLRAEQSLIREDMERLRNRVQKESASTYRTSTQVNAQRVDRPTNQAASNGLNLDSTWDASKEQRQILTQDSQGETVHTPINQATSDRALLSWYEEEMFKIDKSAIELRRGLIRWNSNSVKN